MRLIQKDALSEFRTRQALPAMVLMGVVVAVIFTVQLSQLPHQREQFSGMMLWVALFFAGLIGIERSCAAERTNGCWDALLAYPVSPVLIFWSKFLLNVIVLCALEVVLVPLFSALSDVNLFRPPWAIVSICLAANIGFAAVGTFLSAVLNGIRNGSQLLVLLLLPLMIPLLLAAAEATRLTAAGTLETEWWRWLQLLIGFSVIYTTAGSLLFGIVIEE
ncbi:MAG: heme exporter protein CcmB [Planctomycetaceae bacterium]|nr:heme exporter protein CcmB [Planctomycetaceae bacterium]